MIKPGKAIWHTKEYDLEVDVIKYLGENNGQRYWLVRGQDGETGVLEQELIQKKSLKSLIDIFTDSFDRVLLKFTEM